MLQATMPFFLCNGQEKTAIFVTHTHAKSQAQYQESFALLHRKRETVVDSRGASDIPIVAEEALLLMENGHDQNLVFLEISNQQLGLRTPCLVSENLSTLP